jgi:hypothetical protein
MINGMIVTVPTGAAGPTGSMSLVVNGTAMIDAATAADRITVIEISVDGTPVTDTIRGEFSTSALEWRNASTAKTITGLTAYAQHVIKLLGCSTGNNMSVIANGASVTVIAALE